MSEHGEDLPGAGVRWFRGQGLKSHRLDGDRYPLVCPCALVRHCPEQSTPEELRRSIFCDQGAAVMTGSDHRDAWYKGGKPVAVAHYPYGITGDELFTAIESCRRLGLRLDVNQAQNLYYPGASEGIVIRPAHGSISLGL